MLKNIIFFLSFSLFHFSAVAGDTIYCSHSELCKMIHVIAFENKISDLRTETLVTVTGDPHEYEPSISEIKNLIKAPLLLTGPHELNPWIKKINFQRSKLALSSPHLKTISLLFNPKDYQLYPNVKGEILSHFWLYPKAYCSLKAQLETALIKLNYKIKVAPPCDFQTVEKELQNALAKIDRPLILTHDALLPLLVSLAKKKTLTIVAIKGSGHHEEINPQAVKKMYDALKAPHVIWLQENGINVPSNILNKMRASDQIIQLETAKTQENSPFSVLLELANKLNQLSENL